MKDVLQEIVAGCDSPLLAVNRSREYLQARILGSIQRAGGMVPLAFYGGTALRFLYRLPRFSEDLDFAVERSPGEEPFDLRRLVGRVDSALRAEGYDVQSKVSDRRTVHSARVRFGGLLHELGLSHRREQILSIKLEVDTRPPAGAVLETTVVRRFVTLQLQHHDRASLLAGKLHALLQRPYAKGRDLYDLLWYLSDPEWPAPNLTLLDNALRQTGGSDAARAARGWREATSARLAELDWPRVVADVEPFLEPGEDPALLTLENLRRLLASRRPAR
jgi:predicted nucleotidyltransferase component of viral defense system